MQPLARSAHLTKRHIRSRGSRSIGITLGAVGIGGNVAIAWIPPGCINRLVALNSLLLACMNKLGLLLKVERGEALCADPARETGPVNICRDGRIGRA